MADNNVPITADADVTIDCDNDNNSTSQKIIFSHDNGTELMRIQENGNVGIGTTSPSVPLHVSGNVIGTGNLIRFGSAAGSVSTALKFETLGTYRDAQAGLGVSSIADTSLIDFFVARGSHASKTAINENDALGQIAFRGYAGATGGYVTGAYIDVQSSGAVSDATNGVGAYLRFATRSAGDTLAERMRIQPDGKVGIGATSPGALLDVRGDVIINEDGADKDVRIEGDTDANLLVADASTDRVGIGTASPSKKLEVNGDAKISGFADFKASAARVRRSSNMSIADSTFTSIEFDVEDFDNDDLHSTTTNNTRLTASKAGIWLIGGHLHFAPNGSGFRQMGISLNGDINNKTIAHAIVSGLDKMDEPVPAHSSV